MAVHGDRDPPACIIIRLGSIMISQAVLNVHALLPNNTSSIWRTGSSELAVHYYTLLCGCQQHGWRPLSTYCTSALVSWLISQDYTALSCTASRDLSQSLSNWIILHFKSNPSGSNKFDLAKVIQSQQAVVRGTTNSAPLLPPMQLTC